MNLDLLFEARQLFQCFTDITYFVALNIEDTSPR